MAAFDRRYRGISVLSYGGPLEGEVRLGIDGDRPIWRTPDGLEVCRFGRHPAIQCAVVISIDGRLGCSWTGEFTPLFDSVVLFIENAAAWAAVRSWRYVAVGDVSVEVVLDRLDSMTVDASASGRLATWWASPDCAMTAQRWLNPGRGSDPQVCVLARTRVAFDESRRRLGGLPGAGPFLFTAADVRGTPDR
jgi:hypothetical protein